MNATDKQLAASLYVKGKEGEWWIYGFCDPMGPYGNRKEAEEDRRGVAAFWRNIDNRNFFTTD